MRVVVISDEISDDLEEAIRLGKLLGIDAYELRWVRLPGAFRRRRVSELSDEEATALADIAGSEAASISALSLSPLSGQGNGSHGFDDWLAHLERGLRVARLLGTTDLVVQWFVPPEERRNGVCPHSVIDTLQEAADRAQQEGLRLLLRNSPDGYTNTGAHTAAIVHAVQSEALGVSWDPCHAARAGEAAVSEGYPWVAPFVRDVRVKDQTLSHDHGYDYTVLGQGSMEWRAQFEALAHDNYQGTVTLGPQLEPRLLSTMHSLEALRSLLAMPEEPHYDRP